jgi:hypothetical protein
MVMVTVVDPTQLEPDPNAPLQVCTPEDNEVMLPDPRVPPDPIVVCPPRCGNAAMPDDGVIALGVASPIVTDSVRAKLDPAVATALSVCIRAGTPAVKLETLSPPIALDVVDPPAVTDGVIFVPDIEYVVPNLFVTEYGISTEIWADVVNFCVMSASATEGLNSNSSASSFFIFLI